MNQLIQNYKAGELRVEEVQIPPTRPSGVLVQNAYPLIGAGIERQSIGNARKS